MPLIFCLCCTYWKGKTCIPTKKKKKTKKHNFKRKNQVILLMITDGKKWHYLSVKSWSASLRGITSNHKEDIHCLNCFQSYSTKEKLKNDE